MTNDAIAFLNTFTGAFYDKFTNAQLVQLANEFQSLLDRNQRLYHDMHTTEEYTTLLRMQNKCAAVLQFVECLIEDSADFKYKKSLTRL